MTLRVLVTGAGSFLGHGIIKSLRMSELDVSVVGGDPSPLATGLYRCDAAYLLPLARDDGYVAAVRNIVDREQINAILIGTDVELMKLAAERNRFAQLGCVVIVSSPEVLAIADDKWRTSTFLRENGFRYPESRLGPQANELIDVVGFPLIVKPRVGARSVGVHVVRDAASLQEAVAKVDHPIVQQYLLPEDQEFTVGTLTFDGTCADVITMRRDLRDGNTFRAHVRDVPEVRELARAVAERLGGRGPINLQLRLTAAGPTIFEINARFSGTTPLRAAMGWNEVDAVLRREVLHEPGPPLTFREGIVLRYLNEVVVDPADVARLSTDGRLTAPISTVMDDF